VEASSRGARRSTTSRRSGAETATRAVWRPCHPGISS
jgi:hypothetical protein